jgi:hypothetical protein
MSWYNKKIIRKTKTNNTSLAQIIHFMGAAETTAVIYDV